MSFAEFAYTEKRGRFYPTIPIHIKNKGTEINLEVLVDSGASFGTFREEVANLIGIKIEAGERRESMGISGKIEVFLHEVELKIFDRWFMCRIAFSRQLTSSFNLLGRHGFFERHLIAFNEKERKIIITEF